MTKNEKENLQGFIILISIIKLKVDPVIILADRPELVARAKAFGIPASVSCFHNLLAQASSEISMRAINEVSK